MSKNKKPGFIERMAESIGIIPNLHREEDKPVERLTDPGKLTKFPPPEKWDDWVEYEAKAWPKVEKKNYTMLKKEPQKNKENRRVNTNATYTWKSID